ncbi:SPOR domain-containing protein [Legionella israelensis]|uniref:SPOR domain-containing protein n=1 Tax=Legionella israelensis TaxID=454 RepID=A0A0W0WBR8_9GAMM|nr:SPOR domain-containing protein [Legionella israelensis]KTD29762.1 hypothetical protein Lisr_0822 [Legionella israelensis]QBS08887.1 SPOR domain-containing protein [Legionella israelensis]SCY03145.1 Sporulation related domain-containing protein [Legionella israelensis DSM 19235]STX58573.1 Uncharacterized protein conserved in bacteria [Legionella israelensis]
MNHKNKLIIMSLCVAGLSSCTSMFEESQTVYQPYSYSQSHLYPEGRQPTSSNYEARDASDKPVSVPNTYHVGEYHSPSSHKNRDKNWVNSQNPMGYTVEVADDEKASSVASKLQSTPQNDRRAEVEYTRGGKTHYKGLYGTYDSYQAAKKALDSLPPEIKQNAKVRNWGTVQGNINR